MWDQSRGGMYFLLLQDMIKKAQSPFIVSLFYAGLFSLTLIHFTFQVLSNGQEKSNCSKYSQTLLLFFFMTYCIVLCYEFICRAYFWKHALSTLVHEMKNKTEVVFLTRSCKQTFKEKKPIHFPREPIKITLWLSVFISCSSDQLGSTFQSQLGSRLNLVLCLTCTIYQH